MHRWHESFPANSTVLDAACATRAHQEFLMNTNTPAPNLPLEFSRNKQGDASAVHFDKPFKGRGLLSRHTLN
jgi:hypothetical protein